MFCLYFQRLPLASPVHKQHIVLSLQHLLLSKDITADDADEIVYMPGKKNLPSALPQQAQKLSGFNLNAKPYDFTKAPTPPGKLSTEKGSIATSNHASEADETKSSTYIPPHKRK